MRLLACDDGDPRLARARESTDPAVSEVFVLPELNGKDKDRYLCNNRPRGPFRSIQGHISKSRSAPVGVLRNWPNLGHGRSEAAVFGPDFNQ